MVNVSMTQNLLAGNKNISSNLDYLVSFTF